MSKEDLDNNLGFYKYVVAFAGACLGVGLFRLFMAYIYKFGILQSIFTQVRTIWGVTSKQPNLLVHYFIFILFVVITAWILQRIWLLENRFYSSTFKRPLNLIIKLNSFTYIIFYTFLFNLHLSYQNLPTNFLKIIIIFILLKILMISFYKPFKFSILLDYEDLKYFIKKENLVYFLIVLSSSLFVGLYFLNIGKVIKFWPDWPIFYIFGLPLICLCLWFYVSKITSKNKNIEFKEAAKIDSITYFTWLILPFGSLSLNFNFLITYFISLAVLFFSVKIFFFRKTPAFINNDSFKNALWMMFDYGFLVVIFFTIMYSPIIHFFEVDTGAEAKWLYCADTVFRGGLPFIDTMMHRGIFTIYLPSLIMKLFGNTIFIERVHFIIKNLVALFICCLLVKKIIKSRAFYYLSLFSIVLFTTFRYLIFNVSLFYSNADMLRIGSGLLALVFLFKFLESYKNSWLYFAGLIVAFNFFYSTEYGLVAVVSSLFFFCLIFITRHLNWKRCLRGFFIFLIGFLSCAGGLIIYYWLKGVPPVKTVSSTLWHVITYQKGIGGYRPFPKLPIGISFSLRSYFNVLTNEEFKFYLPIIIYLFSIVLLFLKDTSRGWKKNDLMITALVFFGIFSFVSPLLNGSMGYLYNASAPAIILGLYLLEKAYLKRKSYKKSIPGSNFIPKLKLQGLNIFLIGTLFWAVIVPGGGIDFLDKVMNKYDYFQKSRIGRVKFEHPKAGDIYIIPSQANYFNETVHLMRTYVKNDEETFFIPGGGIYYYLSGCSNATRFDTIHNFKMCKELEEEVIKEIEEKKVKYIFSACDLKDVRQYSDAIVDYIIVNYVLYKKQGAYTPAIYKRRNK